MKIQENVRLSELTTMRLGGVADFLIDVETEDEAREAFDFIEDKNLPVYFLGAGANSIGRDAGFRGVILRNKIMGLKVLHKDAKTLEVRVSGGVVWDDFVAWAVEKDFSGVELLAKVPGSIAAAPVQNIGAYGAEAADTILKVEAYDSLLDEFVEISAADCHFAYRHSIFNSGETRGRYFILAVTFRLTKACKQPPFYNSLQAFLDEHHTEDYSPKTLYNAVATIRAAKLPDPSVEPSAGSFFKNIYLDETAGKRAEQNGIPVRQTTTADGKIQYKVNTGWLLEHAGLKGKNFYGFELSDKAALVLINRSGKSEQDLSRAVAEIKAAVRTKFGFELEQEPELIQ